MAGFSLNHMTIAKASYIDLLELASELGIAGIELRNDLPGLLFDGMEPEEAGALAQVKGLKILSLAELKCFDQWSDSKAGEASELLQIAAECGAEAVSLIPRNDKKGIEESNHLSSLRQSMLELKPMLEKQGLVGMIEPLGFETCFLRNKEEIVAEIVNLGAEHCYKLVHDTFHHHLAGGGPMFPDHTGIVHISGVSMGGIARSDLRDEHRGLVNSHDRLDNIGQLKKLTEAGYSGPVSFEVFSPEIHNLADPKTAILESKRFIQTQLNAVAA